MNANEPLAWMQTWENQDGELKRTVNIEQIGKQDIPLYTHPIKELTDEQIMEVANEIFSTYKNWHHYQIDFAREILRKASEK